MIILLGVFIIISLSMFMYIIHMKGEKSQDSVLTESGVKDLVEVIGILEERIKKLEGWTVGISETYNVNKDRMVKEIVGVSEWSLVATDMINESKDDVDDLKSHIQDLSIRILDIERRKRGLIKRRVVMTNCRY